jgi:phage gpG-like protein
MTVSIALTIDDGGLAPALGRLVALGQDLTPVYEALGLRFVENVKRRFALEIEPDLTPWMTTHPRASKKNPKTLQDSGPAPGSLIDRQFSQAARDGVEWGTDWPFARTHQFGATIRPKNAKALVFAGARGELVFAQEVHIPARPMVGWGPMEREAAEEVILGALDAAAGGSAAP